MKQWISNALIGVYGIAVVIGAALIIAICSIVINHITRETMKRYLIDIDINAPYSPDTAYYVMLKVENKTIVEATLFSDNGIELETTERHFRKESDAVRQLIKQLYNTMETAYVETQRRVNEALNEKKTVKELKEDFAASYDGRELTVILEKVKGETNDKGQGD